MGKDMANVPKNINAEDVTQEQALEWIAARAAKKKAPAKEKAEPAEKKAAVKKPTAKKAPVKKVATKKRA